MTDTLNHTGTYPRLSVVVNNYNYARYLPQALDSAIGQLREGDELIVVDDGSTDDSPALLREYQRSHGIRLICQQNSGQMCAVRVGIDEARGDVVVLLDSDDYFLDGYLDRLREIYSAHPEVSFTFSNARLDGDFNTGLRRVRANLDRMELTPGIVGTTKWAALLFHEFVGVPTSGISLRVSLANTIISLPANLNATVTLSPLLARFLGISRSEQRKSGYTADGVIVRSASILQSVKYYDERPGFMYRIHGSNKYATTSVLGRWYLRWLRKKEFRKMIGQRFSLFATPSASELQDEILNRSFGKRRLRRIQIRASYCRTILSSQGNIAQKTRALKTALGFQGRTSRACTSRSGPRGSCLPRHKNMQ